MTDEMKHAEAMASGKKGHPRALYVLFFTEMWERFSYYGMRALLTLYLTAKLIDGGFGMDRESALSIYAIFTGLVYLTPIIGGWFADKVLGQRKAIFIGAFTMALGQFLLAASAWMASGGDEVSRQFMFNLGLGILILGNGFFKPNISTIVGELYEKDDPRKDGGFTIFYMGINIGALLAPFVAGTLGEQVAWQWGFVAAGSGMLLSTVWFGARARLLGNKGMAPNVDTERTGLNGKDWFDILLYFLGNIVVVFGLLKLLDVISSGAASTMFITIGVLLGMFILYSIIRGTNGSNEWSRVGVIIVLAFFNVVFWAGFEQAGGTFNLFADENTNRHVLGFLIPATWFQNINPILIVVLAPLYSFMWFRLSKAKMNPRTSVKFAFGLLFGAAAFFIMSIAANKASGGHLVSPLWLTLVYTLATCGELMLSPIGLSMITKLSPPKIVSIMMGVWMASFAAGNYMAGMLESILNKYDLALYPFLASFTLGSAVLLLLLSPVLNKMMKGIH